MHCPISVYNFDILFDSPGTKFRTFPASKLLLSSIYKRQRNKVFLVISVLVLYPFHKQANHYHENVVLL